MDRLLRRKTEDGETAILHSFRIKLVVVIVLWDEFSKPAYEVFNTRNSQLLEGPILMREHTGCQFRNENWLYEPISVLALPKPRFDAERIRNHEDQEDHSLGKLGEFVVDGFVQNLEPKLNKALATALTWSNCTGAEI